MRSNFQHIYRNPLLYYGITGIVFATLFLFTVFIHSVPGANAAHNDPSLIGHWKFDGNGNNEVAGGQSAVTVGGAFINSNGGKIGGYAYIPGGSDYLKIPYASIFDLPDSFSIEFWFRQHSDQSFAQDLVYKGNGINNYNFRIFRQLWNEFNDGPIITGYTADATGFWTQTSNPNDMAHNVWHHVVFVKSPTWRAYYLDGNEIHSSTVSPVAKTPASDIIIGDSAVDTDIDNLRIYSRALTAAEVLENGDTTPPSVPTGLTASAISSSQINLSWASSTDTVGVTGYKIYRGGSQIATTTNTPYSDTGLATSTSYSYTVAAYDEAGNVSAQSGSVNATTQGPPDTTPPSVPTGLTASAISSSQINLSWATSTDNVSVTGYRIYRGDSQIATTTNTPYSDA